jgi:hypothetical protein
MEHGFIYISGIAEYIKGRQIIRPLRGDQITDSSANLITRYEKGELAIEFAYTVPDGRLDCLVYPDRINRLRLQDILQALKKQADVQILEHPLPQPESLKSALHLVASLLHDNQALLDDADRRIFERAMVLREKLIEHHLREQLKREIDLACAQAARAFMQKDYSRVIILLRAYENFLSSGDLKKLNFARKQMTI